MKEPNKVMSRRTVSINCGVNFLNDAMLELPVNCIFDKGKVGCGGTTIALTDTHDTIICVPFVSLIENKVNQKMMYPNVLGVYEGVSLGAIKEYLAGSYVKKIMVTFDSLEKIMKYINPSEYNLLVDEYHLLFTQYSFRREAVQKVLSNFRKFNSFCFMTATVLDDDFVLEELQGLELVVAEWDEVREVTVNSVKCKKDVTSTVINLVNRFLSNEVAGNAYIFVNSVEFIKDIIANCELNEFNCRLIYSRGNRTVTSIRRGSLLDTPKKINFLTSTAFEGSDIYDENGKIFIVSDSRRKHTLTDISTSFQQIAGRIRNTKYWNEITHIFTTTRYDGNLTYDEFKEACQRTIEKSSSFIAQLMILEDDLRSIISLPCERYVTKVDDIFSFDPNLVKIDLYNFKICKGLYKTRVNISVELKKEGYAVREYNSNLKLDVIRMDSVENNFESVVKSIKYLETTDITYMAAMVKYPFLKAALTTVGFEGIEHLKYEVTSIKRKVINNLPITLKSKVMMNLKLTNEVDIGQTITAKRAKELVSQYYIEFNILKSANIKDFFVVKEIRIWNSILHKTELGYTICISKY